MLDKSQIIQIIVISVILIGFVLFIWSRINSPEQHEQVTMKSQIIGIVVSIILIIACVLFIWFRNVAPILNSPEQQEQAEIIEKRIVEERSGDGDGFTYHYIVAFEFSNGTVKELRVGVERSGHKRYDALNEGDTGILTYKERTDIEEKYKNENIRFEGRRFISFEKDIEYGGTKVEELPDITFLIIGIGFFIFLAVILIVPIIVSDKKELTSSESDDYSRPS